MLRNVKRDPRKNIRERFIATIMFVFALFTVMVTLAVVVSLASEVVGFFSEIPILDFLTGTQWTPLFADAKFGILPLVNGTLLLSAISLLVAVPLGLSVAVYLSEYATTAVRTRVQPYLELLAGIPTVVFAYFALFFLTPLLQNIVSGLNIFNSLAAGIVLGFALIPYISSVCVDAMQSVPRGLREAGYGLGATKFEVVVRVVIPAALSGIVAAIILATSRAIGETMIAAVAAGQQPNLTIDPRQTIATMTAFIVQAATGDQPVGSIGARALYAVAATLFLITLGLNVIAQRIVERYGERYE
ncbi:MAG: phosphate ABC transporter permease subunit PstC [Deinococcales bacterium]